MTERDGMCRLLFAGDGRTVPYRNHTDPGLLYVYFGEKGHEDWRTVARSDTDISGDTDSTA